MKSWLAALLGMVALTLSISAHSAEKAAPRVPIYDSTQIALDRYTVVKRLGVQGWRSGYYVPSFPEVEIAVEALMGEAASLDADGLVNVYCLGRSDRLKGEGYYCYGNAIKVKQ